MSTTDLAFVEKDPNKLRRMVARLADEASRQGKFALFIEDEEELAAGGNLISRTFIFTAHVETLSSPQLGKLGGIFGSYRHMIKFYLTWRRFQVCNTLILYEPFKILLNPNAAPFFDGLIGRIRSQRRRVRICVFTTPSAKHILQQWLSIPIRARGISVLEGIAKSLSKESIREELLTILYYAHLSWGEILGAVEKTVWWLIHSDSAHVKHQLKSLVEAGLVERSGGKYSTSPKGAELVESLTLIAGKPELRRRIIQPMFKKKQKIARVSETALEKFVLKLIGGKGYASAPTILQALSTQLPSPISIKTVYRILNTLSKKGILQKTPYLRARGRPQIIYYRQRKLPAFFQYRCHQCAFYIKPQSRCTLWSTIKHRFRLSIEELEKRLSKVELDKLGEPGGSIRLNLNSTACPRLVERRRAYSKLEIASRLVEGAPHYLCEICDFPLPKPPSTTTSTCLACGSKYKILSDGKIHITPDYHHLYIQHYTAIVGSLPPEEKKGEEKGKITLLLWPDDEVELTPETISVQRGKRKLRYLLQEVTYVIDYGSLTDEQWRILSERGVRITSPFERATPLPPKPEITAAIEHVYQTQSPLIRKLAQANGLSLILATIRLKKIFPQLYMGAWLKAIRIQINQLEKMHTVPIHLLLAYEGLIAKYYWSLYKTICRQTRLWFHSRKRERLVRELTDNPRARARGYTPINAAINYLHQRRVFKCRKINMEKGLGWVSGEGLLHRARRKERIGLLLDLSDSLKLADRETLLQACLEGKITYEDFTSSLGRQGVKFYYPTYDALLKLEEIGVVADNKSVYYDGEPLPLMKAYEKSVENFTQALLEGGELKPFIYAEPGNLPLLTRLTRIGGPHANQVKEFLLYTYLPRLAIG